MLSKNTFTFDKIIATDAKFKRLERLKENIQLWQIPALCSLVEWGTQKETAPVKAQNYDIILADLPCSGLGTLLSRPDILTKKVSNAVYELQNKILDDLFLKLKKPGLLLVLSVVAILKRLRMFRRSLRKNLTSHQKFHTTIAKKLQAGHFCLISVQVLLFIFRYLEALKGHARHIDTSRK